MLRAADRETPPVLTYSWKPITLSEADEGPGLEDYLVAIAEAGSFGADLLLPLHDRFEKSLLLGRPEVRADWDRVRRYMNFYSWNLSMRYEPVANIGVVTAEPMRSFEVVNLLARHNLPFDVIAPRQLTARNLSAFDSLIVLDEPPSDQIPILAEFARKGGGGGSGRGRARPRRERTAVAQRDARSEDRRTGLLQIRRRPRDRNVKGDRRSEHLRARDAPDARPRPSRD
jgi:hypothetical protein